MTWRIEFDPAAEKELKEENPLKRTGGVMDQWNSRPLLRVKAPEKGDLFVMSFGKGLGHIGFVDNVQLGNIVTIEGNATGENMGREGYIVCRKQRKIVSCIGFIRL